jgi:hypothetical protein
MTTALGLGAPSSLPDLEGDQMHANDNGNLPSGEWVLVTPELAAKWLIRNTHNRSSKTHMVKQYAADMAAGRWMPTGEPVEFSPPPDEVLLNGQNRLTAIVESGVSVHLLVMRNVPIAAQVVMDTGAKRTLADALKLRGEAHVTTLAAAIRHLANYRSGRNIGTKQSPPQFASVPALLGLYEREPTLTHWTAPASATYMEAGFPSIGLLAALMYLFHDIDPDEAPTFFERLGSGLDLTATDPIYALRRVLARMGNGAIWQLDVVTVAALTIKAFNYWRLGREVEILTWRRGGAKPESFPTIDPALPR